MHRALVILIAFFACGTLAFAADAPKAPEPGGEKPKDPAFAPVTDVPGLPRVLLIGDSISIGYTIPVREALKGKANVHRNEGNGGTSHNGVKMAEKWIGDQKWDVIHFNFGLHDIKIMKEGKQQVEIEEYEKNLREVVAKLKKSGAKLIFATTTPVPDAKQTPMRVTSDVVKYNAVALKVMKEEGVAVDDLYEAILPRIAKVQKSANVHFNAQGSKILGDQVVASVLEALKK